MVELVLLGSPHQVSTSAFHRSSTSNMFPHQKKLNFNLNLAVETRNKKAQILRATATATGVGKSMNAIDKKTTMLSTAASVATAMLIQTIKQDLLPDLQNYCLSGMRNLILQRLSSDSFDFILQCFSSDFTIIVDEFRGFSRNKLFDAANTYLATKLTTCSSAHSIKVGINEDENNLAITMDKDEEIEDEFEGMQLEWSLRCSENTCKSSASSNRKRLGAATRESELWYYALTFHKEYKDKVLSSYLPYVLARAEAIHKVGKPIKLYTVGYRSWGSNVVNLDHPMTFSTLAIDSELKKTIMEDLDNFKNSKEFYRRIGKALKRGYLLYGPPGTGKSSLIASIANYLHYDIYDLDLTALYDNSDLRTLLLGMSSRSILVIEDIDCSLKLENREADNNSSSDNDDDDDDDDDDESNVTLSGLLNFIDGIWSCCGEERIFIFTTNHKETLDPALLRPGRMDMHIHMSYCTFSAFKQLALNYLQIKDHHLFKQTEELLQDAKATPAEVGAELMRKSFVDPTTPLQGLIEFLKKKKDIQESKEGNDQDSQVDKVEEEDSFLVPTTMSGVVAKTVADRVEEDNFLVPTTMSGDLVAVAN